MVQLVTSTGAPIADRIISRASSVEHHILSLGKATGVYPIHAYSQLYTASLDSKHFERKLRVVLLLDTRSQKYILLASTHYQQSAQQIAQYYPRFQIELPNSSPVLVRVRPVAMPSGTARAVPYQLNASLCAVNVGQQVPAADPYLFNLMNALVRRQTSRRIWKPIYNQLSVYGLVDYISA